jgi:hypothetical protein
MNRPAIAGEPGHATIPPMNERLRRQGVRAAQLRVLAIVAFATVLSSCIPTRFETESVIPAPLVTKIPIVVGVYMSEEFRTRVHEEERDGASYTIGVGHAQYEGFMRLMNAMFDRVVPVSSPEVGAQADPELRGVLEPVLEDVAFITPQDSGTPMYAVSLRYRINGYSPSGELMDSWTFTGYGTEAASKIPTARKASLQQATAKAMRDAGAKIATELRNQAIIRGLLPEESGMTPVELTPPP